LAKQLGRVPMVDYATLVLNNWKLKEPTLPLTLENLSVIWSFTKSKAEEWFYIIHVVIENHGAEAMKAVKILTE
jgi:indoleamine 2,3-dioxygenase